MLSGLDAALHLAEECLEPERIVPRAVMVTVLTAFMTAFPFAIAAVYSCKDVAATLDDPTGYRSFHQDIQKVADEKGYRYTKSGSKPQTPPSPERFSWPAYSQFPASL